MKIYLQLLYGVISQLKSPALGQLLPCPIAKIQFLGSHSSDFRYLLEYLQISQVMTDLLTPAVNKVPGYYSKWLSALANKPPNMQIFAPSKFGINRSADLKVMAKKF